VKIFRRYQLDFVTGDRCDKTFCVVMCDLALKAHYTLAKVSAITGYSGTARFKKV
jgi:hypothetical protein